MAEEITQERTLGQKLKDARRAQSDARRILGRAIREADDANGYVHTRRAKLDVWDERVRDLEAAWEAGQRAIALAAELAGTEAAQELDDLSELQPPIVRAATLEELESL